RSLAAKRNALLLASLDDFWHHPDNEPGDDVSVAAHFLRGPVVPGRRSAADSIQREPGSEQQLPDIPRQKGKIAGVPVQPEYVRLTARQLPSPGPVDSGVGPVSSSADKDKDKDLATLTHLTLQSIP